MCNFFHILLLLYYIEKIHLETLNSHPFGDVSFPWYSKLNHLIMIALKSTVKMFWYSKLKLLLLLIFCFHTIENTITFPMFHFKIQTFQILPSCISNVSKQMVFKQCEQMLWLNQYEKIKDLRGITLSINAYIFSLLLFLMHKKIKTT
jgi:hypothetical protein